MDVTLSPRTILQYCLGEPLFLAEQFKLSDADAINLVNESLNALTDQPIKASDLLSSSSHDSLDGTTYKKTYDDANQPYNTLFNDILEGKIPYQLKNGIIEVVGEAGSGKSHFCYIVAAQILLESHDSVVFWVDTEQKFNVQRLLNIIHFKKSKQSINPIVPNTIDLNHDAYNKHILQYSIDKTLLERCVIIRASSLSDILNILIFLLNKQVRLCSHITRNKPIDNPLQRNLRNNSNKSVLIIDSIAAAIRHDMAYSFFQDSSETECLQKEADSETDESPSVDPFTLKNCNRLTNDICEFKRLFNNNFSNKNNTINLLKNYICQQLKRLCGIMQLECHDTINSDYYQRYSIVSKMTVIVVNQMTTVFESHPCNLVQNYNSNKLNTNHTVYLNPHSSSFDAFSYNHRIQPALGFQWSHFINCRLHFHSTILQQKIFQKDPHRLHYRIVTIDKNIYFPRCSSPVCMITTHGFTSIE